MRYSVYLILSFVMQLLAWVITPILPLFKVDREGFLDNSDAYGIGPRLPTWLAWFDTPDNALSGDSNWYNNHNPYTYWSMVGWLYRNSLYGFKWKTLACKVDNPEEIDGVGDSRVNRNNGVTGLFKAKYKDYWQWKLVKKIYGNFGIMWNFGWQLDEFYKSKQPGIALFQFSPRFVSIK